MKEFWIILIIGVGLWCLYDLIFKFETTPWGEPKRKGDWRVMLKEDKE